MNLRLLATGLLAAGLLLGTLGCSKKDDPEPALQGTWDVTSLVTAAYTNGKQQTQNTIAYPGRNDPNGTYMTVTSTTMDSHYNYGGSTGPLEYYTRSGNTLSMSLIASGSSTPTLVRTDTVMELTATNLAVLSKGTAAPGSSYDYYTYEVHFKRR